MRFPILCLAVGAVLFAVPAFSQTSDSATAPATTAAAPASGHYSTGATTLGDLLDDPAAKAVLVAHIPDLVSNPQVSAARPMTLRDLQAYVPNLTDATLAAIDADLAKLPSK